MMENDNLQDCSQCIFKNYFLKRFPAEGKAVLLAVSEGCDTNKKVSDKLNILPAAVSRYFLILRELGLIYAQFGHCGNGIVSLRNYKYQIVDDPKVHIIINFLKNGN